MKIGKMSLIAALLLASCYAMAMADSCKTQEKCPVMGNKINKQIYTDHNGQRVYFCCKACIPKFRKNPEKYLSQMEKKGIVLAKAGDGQAFKCKSGACGTNKKEACSSGKCKKDDCESCKVASECKKCDAKKSCPASAEKTSKLTIIDTKTLETLINSGTDMVILDARSGQYDDGRRIPGAKALSPKADAKEAEKLISAKDTLIEIGRAHV